MKFNMKFKNKAVSLIMCGALFLSNLTFVFADSTRVVTIGVNNSPQQKETILKYFGVNENEVEVISVNNQEERQYLEGIATEAQIGTKTYSCAYTCICHRLCTRPCSAYRHQPWLLVEHRILVFRPYMHCISDYKVL